ncbi:MAG: hypothetical protein V4504_00095 [Patescibacteria group bacterium]
MEKLEYFEEYYVIRNSLGGIYLQKNAGDPPSQKDYDYEDLHLYERDKKNFKHNLLLASMDLEMIYDKRLREEILKTMSPIKKVKALKAVSIGKVLKEPSGIITKEQYKELKQ